MKHSQMAELRSTSASSAVNEQRLWQRHMEMARIGSTPKGGVRRLALTPLDIEARDLFTRWAQDRGWDHAMDPIGNLFVRRPGTDLSLSPIVSGSHLDTQPAGGRFDGIY